MGEPLITVDILPSFNPWWEPKIKLWRADAEGATYHLTAQPWMGRVPFERPLWYESERSLNPSQTEELLALLRKSTSISSKYPTSPGLDSTSYKVSIQQGGDIVTFSWWSEAPEPWEPVQLIAETLLRLVDKEVIATEEAFYREGRTAPQVMSILRSNLDVVEKLSAKSGLKQLQWRRDYCRRLSEWFGTYSPSECKQLARESRRSFDPPDDDWEKRFIEIGLKLDPAWLEEYRIACRKLCHSFIGRWKPLPLVVVQ